MTRKEIKKAIKELVKEGEINKDMEYYNYDVEKIVNRVFKNSEPSWNNN